MSKLIQTFTSYPMMSRFVLLLLVILLSALTFLNQYYSGNDDGVLLIEKGKGLTNPVEIHFDDKGIASVNARSRNDAYFATGYLHASDRLTQLELQRRLVRGQMSELLGRGHLNSDIWMRTLGLYRKAQKSLEYLSPNAIAALEAYSAGINHFLARRQSPTVEFDLLDIRPEAWTPADSLAIQKLLALNLGMNFNRELENVLAETVLKGDQDLDSATTGLLQSKYQMEQVARIGGKGVGSNAWVISGKHTASGKPLLANDPHLNMSIPSIWYAVSQRGGDLDSSGMTLVGMPVVIFGANNHIAWGGTNLLADVQDLVLERQHPTDRNLYFHQGQWLPFEVTEEVIHIKADPPASLQKPIKPVKILVRHTVNGPVISDIQSPLDAPLALRWTALSERDHSFESLLKINLAHDWQSFNFALADYHAPTLNFLYADKQNNIGYVAAGTIPTRQNYNGQTPVAGWLPEYRWQGKIAFENMPRQFNPELGYIINANDQVSAKNGEFISADWVDPARAKRIEQLLKQYIDKGEKIDVAATGHMQMDTLDLNGQAFAGMMQEYHSDDPQIQQVIEQLAKWDGEMSQDSIAPVMYVLWLGNIKSRLLEDDLFTSWGGQKPLRDQFLTSYMNGVGFAEIATWLVREDGLCDRRDTTKTEICSDMVIGALNDSVADLEKLTGSDMDDWRWNELGKVLVPHPIFSRSSVLKDIYNRQYRNFGTFDTVNVSGYGFDAFEGFTKSFGATFRQVISTADEIEVYSMNSTGQSENVLSRHYDDMVEAFAKGELIKVKGTAESGANHNINRQ